MLRPEIDWKYCQCCNPCVARLVCKPRAIIKIDVDEPAVVELSRCNSCGLCVMECPYDAIIMKNSSTAAYSPNGCLPFR